MTNLGRVFLIRHPKPEIAPGICYGSSDILPKTAALQSAFSWLERFLPAPARIITSPLTRCAQLALRLSSNPARTCELDPRLAERCCGAWELQDWDQVPRAELDGWAADFMDYCVPGAESVRQMQARVLAAWADYTGQIDQQFLDQQTLVLVTHAGPIQVLLAHVTGAQLCAQPIAEIACGSAVLLTFEDARWCYEIITDSSFNSA